MLHKSIMAFMLTALVSLPLVAQETPSAPKTTEQSKQNLEDDNLPHRNPFTTLFLKDNTEVQIYGNAVSEEASSHLFYLAKPTIIVDPKECYDSKTKELNFTIKISANANEIREQLNAKGYNTKHLVQMPIKGYRIDVSAGKERQTLIEFEGDVQIESVNCSGEITEPRIIKTLEKDVRKLNVEITFFFEFKKMYGVAIRTGFSSKLNQKIEENVLGDKNEVLISRASFDGIVRDACSSVNSSIRNAGYILQLGEGAERLMAPFLEQNKNLFAEKTLEEWGKIGQSLVIYDGEFAREELTPDKIEEFIAEYEKLDESKKHFKKVWKNLKEIRNQSKDVNDFKERSLKEIHIDGEVDGSYCWGFLEAGLEFSFDGKWENETSKYSYSWKDLYDKAAQESFSEEEFFEKHYEKMKGEIRKFYTRPKEYRVMRIGTSAINTTTEFYAQHATIVNVLLGKTFPTTFGEAIKKQQENEKIATLEKELATLKTYPGARRMIKDEVNGVEFAFRWCPAGKFTMGSPEKEWDSEFIDLGKKETSKSTDENPQTKTIPHGFWILETEVTVGMYKAFVKETNFIHQGKDKAYGYQKGGWKQSEDYSWNKPGFSYFHKMQDSYLNNSNQQPVTTVSLDDAKDFCNWLSNKIKEKVQLRTEEQWEYACRAGTSTAYFWGNALLDSSHANLHSSYTFNCEASIGNRFNILEKEEVNFKRQPVDVRSYAPNAWGIYDMHGNVREWCSEGISRNGGWSDIAWGCRSARRVIYKDRTDIQGFRVIIVP